MNLFRLCSGPAGLHFHHRALHQEAGVPNEIEVIDYLSFRKMKARISLFSPRRMKRLMRHPDLVPTCKTWTITRQRMIVPFALPMTLEYLLRQGAFR
jgi:hypothetical protein